MPTFCADWFSQHIPNWEKYLAELKGKPNLSFLEIGCFEGKATLWLLENILTAQTSRIMVIDPFKQTEAIRSLYKDLYTHDYRTIFEMNTAPYSDKILINPSESYRALCKMYPDYKNSFDFIYVDGCHDSHACLSDMVLAWELLKIGGIMVIDDYEWVIDVQDNLKPKLGVDAFLSAYIDRYWVIDKGYQVALKKVSGVNVES